MAGLGYGHGDYDNSGQLKELNPVERYRKRPEHTNAADAGYTVVGRRMPHGQPGDIRPIDEVERHEEMMESFKASVPEDI